MLDWFWSAIVGALLLVAIPFVTSVLGHKVGFPPAATSAWFLIGSGLGIALFLCATGDTSTLFMSTGIPVTSSLSVTPGIFALVCGLTFGAIGNILVFQAFGASPNPGMPMAIVSSNAIVAILATRYLSQIAPELFAFVEFRWAHLIGGCLIIAGVIIVRKWGS